MIATMLAAILHYPIKILDYYRRRLQRPLVCPKPIEPLQGPPKQCWFVSFNADAPQQDPRSGQSGDRPVNRLDLRPRHAHPVGSGGAISLPAGGFVRDWCRCKKQGTGCDFHTRASAGWHQSVAASERRRGLVSPAEFIPLAEKAGIITELGEWALAEAARQVVAWRQRGIAVPRMAVNLSPCQFRAADLADRLEQILTVAGVPTDWIELEITESAAMAHPARAVQVLQRLRERGIQIAMDDFGTGHSSLAMLRTLPLNVLKLHRGFVQHLPDSETDAAVASAVVTLARRLGLSVVAEGVETAAQQQFLADIGCDMLQGFLFARPLPTAELEAWLINRYS